MTKKPTLPEQIKQLIAERDDADRRAGAAERKMEYMSDTIYKHNRIRDEQKEEAGYHTNVSFDIVWKEVLEKANNNFPQDKVKEAVREIVAAIYFNDGSKYLGAMWNALQSLDPETAELLNKNPKEAFDLTHPEIVEFNKRNP